MHFAIFVWIFFINPIFAVDKKDGDIRWILDLRYVKQYCTTFQFKLKTLCHIRSLILQGDYMVSIDLTKAYYHIRIAAQHRCLLAFRFQGKLYRFIALPMGGSFAPFIYFFFYSLGRFTGQLNSSCCKIMYIIV